MAARRPQHRVAHKDCPNGVTSWDACDQATREARGRCTAMTEKEEPCSNWVTDDFEGKGYCGQHYASAVNREKEKQHRDARKAALDVAIQAHFDFQAEHPSVWCKRPDDWKPGDPVPGCPCRDGATYTGAPAAARMIVADLSQRGGD